MKRHDDLTPLRMSMAGTHRDSPALSVTVLAVLLAFVIAATIFTTRANDQQAHLANESRTENVAATIQDRIELNHEIVEGVRNVFTLDPDLDRRSFHEVVERLDVPRRFPGIQVIGVAHLVADDELDAYADGTNAAAEAEDDLDYPDFVVHPDTGADQRLAIDYIEPQVGNERAFGLDFLSEPNRRDAAMLARDTGQMSVTAPITLVQETGEQRAFLLMLPLFREGESTATLRERRAAFEGVVYAAVRMGDLVDGALKEDPPGRLTIVDVASGEFFYGDESDLAAMGSPGPGDERVKQIGVASRPWSIAVDDDDRALSSVQRHVPVVTLVTGLLLAVLVAGLMATMRSARSRAMIYASEMTEELRSLSDSATDAIVSIDEVGRIVAWNRGATEIFGVEAVDVIGRAAEELVAPAQRPAFVGLCESVRSESGESQGRSTVTTCRRSGGERFPAELSMSRWEARGNDYLTVFLRDVTDRVEAQQRLVETSDMLLGVLDAATEISIIGVGLDARIELFNAGAERMLGYRADDVMGHGPDRFHLRTEVEARARELGIEPGFEVFVTKARGGEAETRGWTYVRADGSTLPVELVVTPRYDSAGRLRGFIGIATDVTERVAAQERQQLLLDQERDMVAKLREVDRVKNDFVSTMSHELRTPLTSILGYTELITDTMLDSLPTHGAGMVATIEKNAQRLLSLVEDLLSLSKIESGSLNRRRDPCDVGRLVDAACTAIAPSTSERGIAVDARIDDVARIHADGPQIERVVLNLLTNAVKFSPDGSTVEIEVRGSDDWVDLVVTDHGIGIPADEQQHLFTRFFRSRSAERNAIPGTGLGLTIVADIVDRHGGTIQVDSTEDVGTTVWVRFPVEAADDIAATETHEHHTTEELV
ncbi:CHASE domain-containing protein [Ilumatobacter sp.]|uniref:CHASE domain-containing protein n=1 Tax=Ilumatobacter sp. TaxID=1967498 RepID=UPI003B51F922